MGAICRNTGFAEIVGDYFPVSFHAADSAAFVLDLAIEEMI